MADGVTVFDDGVPAVANLDPALLEALRRAATDAAGDGVEFVVNSARGLAGLALLVLARRRLRDRTGTIMARLCSIGTVLFLVAAGTVIASPVHYAPIRDVDIPAVSSP